MIEKDKWTDDFNKIVQETRNNLHKIETNNFSKSTSIFPNYEQLRKNLSLITSIETLRTNTESMDIVEPLYNYSYNNHIAHENGSYENPRNDAILMNKMLIELRNEFRKMFSVMLQFQANKQSCYVQTENFIHRFKNDLEYGSKIDDVIKILSEKMANLEKRLDAQETTQQKLIMLLNPFIQNFKDNLHDWNITSNTNRGNSTYNTPDDNRDQQTKFQTLSPQRQSYINQPFNNIDTIYNKTYNDVDDKNDQYNKSTFRQRTKHFKPIQSINNQDLADHHGIGHYEYNIYELNKLGTMNSATEMEEDCYRTIYSLRKEYERNKSELELLGRERFHTPEYFYRYLYHSGNDDDDDNDDGINDDDDLTTHNTKSSFHVVRRKRKTARERIEKRKRIPSSSSSSSSSLSSSAPEFLKHDKLSPADLS